MQQLFHFGPFLVEADRRRLSREGQTLAVPSKVFETLLVLLRHRDRVLTKDELMLAVWPDSFVEEANLAQNISTLRKLLGEAPGDNRYIATLPGKGYRFVADVQPAPAEPAEVVLKRQTTTRLVVEDEEEDDATGTAPAQQGEASQPAQPPHPEHATQTSPTRLAVASTAIVFAAALIGAGIYAYRTRQHLPKPKPPAPGMTIVVADFADSTGVAGFGAALKQELAIELQESPSLGVLSEQKVGDTLRLLQRSANQPLTPDRAREVCLRRNSKAFVYGAVSNTGGRYLLTLNAEDCAGGNSLAGIETEAADRSDVPKALRKAAGEIADKLAAALPALPDPNSPLPDNVTGPLAAVQAYAQGVKVDAATSGSEALSYFRRAVELDPDFAMAYLYMAQLHHGLGDTVTARQEYTRAYELRSHVSPVERAAIEGEYERQVTGNLEKAMPAYEEWAQLEPGNAVPHLRLAALAAMLGRYQQQLDEAQAAMRLSAASGEQPVGFGSLLSAYVHMGKLDEAKAALEQRNMKGGWPSTRYTLAFLKNDDAAMQQEVEKAMGGANEGFLLTLAALTEQYHGHMTRARELMAQAVQAGRHLGASSDAAYEVEEAQNEAEAGNVTWARQHVPKVGAEKMWLITDSTAGYVLAVSGDSKAAQQVADQLDRQYPLNTLAQRCWIPQIRAAIALNKNDAKAAISELMTAAPLDLSCQMIPVYVRGLAYLAAGQPQPAAAEFHKILDHPGIVGNEIHGALAHLQLARAQAMAGDQADARKSYEAFLTLWKDADADIPLYQQAKTEYAKLR